MRLARCERSWCVSRQRGPDARQVLREKLTCAIRHSCLCEHLTSLWRSSCQRALADHGRVLHHLQMQQVGFDTQEFCFETRMSSHFAGKGTATGLQFCAVINNNFIFEH
jgi:hypothetical protein